ncbi:MAG TPA: class I SAM-dependent methyltransferase [Lysobacter sp.]|nr:class I SAM-dependent methyltransferase [Lysobacter sp.]
MGTHFQEDWFEHNVANWDQWLAPYKGLSGLRALEIGSFEGRSTCWLLEQVLTAADARIDCIDLFAVDPVYGDYRQRFRRNTAAYRDKVTEHAGPSYTMLKRVEGPYDIVYVDGWHSAFGALADGVMCWPMLKVGGLMIFDDYLWTPPKLGRPRRPNAVVRLLAKLRGSHWKREAQLRQIASVRTETPKLGVDGLLATLEGHYEIVGSGYQIAVRKTRGFDQGQLGHDT